MIPAGRAWGRPALGFLDAARSGRNGWRRWLGSFGLVVVPFVLASALVGGALNYLGRRDDMAAVLPLLNFAAGFGVIGVLGALTGAAVRLVHRRPCLTLVSPDATWSWRRIAVGAGIWGGMQLALFALDTTLDGSWDELRLDPSFGRYLVVALLLVPCQSAAEELVFRGYLTQGLGLLVRWPVVAAMLSAAAFAAAHGSIYGPLSFLFFWIFGLGLSAVALADGRLELAIGAHAANNLFATLISGPDGDDMHNPALYVASDVVLTFGDVAQLAVELAVFFVATRWVLARLGTARTVSAPGGA